MDDVLTPDEDKTFFTRGTLKTDDDTFRKKMITIRWIKMIKEPFISNLKDLSTDDTKKENNFVVELPSKEGKENEWMNLQNHLLWERQDSFTAKHIYRDDSSDMESMTNSFCNSLHELCERESFSIPFIPGEDEGKQMTRCSVNLTNIPL